MVGSSNSWWWLVAVYFVDQNAAVATSPTMLDPLPLGLYVPQQTFLFLVLQLITFSVLNTLPKIYRQPLNQNLTHPNSQIHPLFFYTTQWEPSPWHSSPSSPSPWSPLPLLFKQLHPNHQDSSREEDSPGKMMIFIVGMGLGFVWGWHWWCWCSSLGEICDINIVRRIEIGETSILSLWLWLMTSIEVEIDEKHIFRRWRRERLETACKNMKGRIHMLHNQLIDQWLKFSILFTINWMISDYQRRAFKWCETPFRVNWKQFTSESTCSL